MISPGAIAEADTFQTPVTLDGTRSKDAVDDPEAKHPLSYAWRIDGDDVRFDMGDAHSPTPVVRFRGSRPATIELTVSDVDGLEATAVDHLRLTVSARP